MKIISKNKKAFFHYEVLEQLETGISLQGSEVKSIRKGEVNLSGSYVVINDEGRLVIKEMHIKEYFQSSYHNHEAKRPRFLLAHKKQINKLLGSISSKGITLIPLELYFSGKWIKVKIGLCRGKKIYDKRRSIKEKELKRELDAVKKKQLSEG